MNDFTGFQFNNTHIGNLSLVRVSDGSRYNENILPTFSDKTVVVPGGDGTYYFGSYYTQKPFSLSVAFDQLTENQFRTLRSVFNARDVGWLIFDELPFKKYLVKVQSAPQFKYLCFNTDEVWEHKIASIGNNYESSTLTSNGRVYKGEGTIQLVAYEPFGHSVYKYLNLYGDASYPNKGEWSSSTSMLNSNPNGAYDFTFSSSNVLHSIIHNAGDTPAHFQLILPTAIALNIASITCDGVSNVMVFNMPTSARGENDVYIRINSKTNLIEGLDSNYEPTGTLYNDCLIQGDFFLIPMVLYSTNSTVYFNIQGKENFGDTDNQSVQLVYDYLYY